MKFRAKGCERNVTNEGNGVLCTLQYYRHCHQFANDGIRMSCEQDYHTGKTTTTAAGAAVALRNK